MYRYKPSTLRKEVNKMATKVKVTKVTKASPKYTLNKTDVKRFLTNIVIFNIPTAAVQALVGLGANLDWKSVLITVGIGFLTAFMDFARKLISDGKE